VTVDLVIRDARIVTEDHIFRGSIAVRDGRIAALTSVGEEPAARRVVEADGRHLLPGLVDPHTHIGANRTRSWAELASSETKAAAAGGVTTVMQYCRNYGQRDGSYLDGFDDYVATGRSQIHVDLFFHFTLESDAQIAEIPTYAQRYGIRCFKAYIGGYPPGNEIGLGILDTAQMVDAMRQVQLLGNGGLLAVHVEDVAVVGRGMRDTAASRRQDLPAYTEARPAEAEESDLLRAAYWAKVTGCRLYVPHVTIGNALDLAARARLERGPELVLETCPQYLVLTKDAPIGIRGKCNPPLRDQREQDRLWEGIRRGLISTIGTDHVSSTKGQRGNDLWTEIPGFAGLETLLPLLVTEGVRKGRIEWTDIVRLCSANPARTFGIYPRKGSLLPGADADLVLVDDQTERVVSQERMHTVGTTVYAGQKLSGWPWMTIVRGVPVYEGDRVTAPAGHGSILNLSASGVAR